MPIPSIARSARAPGAALLLGMMTLLGAPAALAQTPTMPEHYAVDSREYEIITDLPRDEIRELAAHMDAVHRSYRQMFSGFDTRSTTPTRLYLWSSRDSYLQHGASMGGNWNGSGGVFFQSGGASGVSTWVADQPRAWLYSLLQHECFHQFAAKHLGPTLPLWANEGLAVYFEHALLVRNDLIQGVTPSRRIDLMKQAIANERHFPVQELMAITSQQWWQVMQQRDGRAAIMYTQAWSLVHFLIHADNGRYKRAFEQYLRAIADGLDHARAFEAAFKTSDTDAFERRWREYVDALEPDPIAEATDRLQFMASGLLWLKEADVMITGVADLKHELQRRKFSMTRVIDGVEHRVDSTDEMFEPPDAGRPASRSRRAAATPTLEALPPQRTRDGAQLPPRFVVKGLRVTVGVNWIVEPDGSLNFDIVYE
ncbi:MAG: DUF1570 domain-containing protein [Phycisphaerales bacterium]